MSSSGANTAVRDKFPRAVMPGTFDYGFYTGLMYKDVRLCVEEGKSLGVPMPIAGAVHQMWLIANAELGPGSDFTEITKIIESGPGSKCGRRRSRIIPPRRGGWPARAGRAGCFDETPDPTRLGSLATLPFGA